MSSIIREERRGEERRGEENNMSFVDTIREIISPFLDLMTRFDEAEVHSVNP